MRKLFEVVPVDVLEWRPDRPIPQPAEASGATIRRVRDTAAADWEPLLDPGARRRIQPSVERGDESYLAIVEDRLVGWIWLSRVTHRDPWSRLRINLASDEAYAYAMRVDPPYRRLGLAPLLVAAMLSDVRNDQTVTRLYGWADVPNRESQLLLRVMFGFTQVQRLKRVHIARRIGGKVPRSDRPPFGPLSRAGRHSTSIGADTPDA